MTISSSAQRFLLWWGVAFGVLYGIALVFLLHMVPPPPPAWTPVQVAAFYAGHAVSMRLGATLAAWTGGFMVPITIVISAQIARLEKGLPIWAITQFAGGGLLTIFLVLPPVLWGAGAFHAGRFADATSLINDVSNLSLVTTDDYFIFQLVPIIVMALSRQTVGQSAFPRWFGYATIWTALVFEVGALGFLFQTGPFAWNGLFVFWCPFVLFGGWIGVVVWLMLRAIRAQEGQEMGRVAA